MKLLCTFSSLQKSLDFFEWIAFHKISADLNGCVSDPQNFCCNHLSMSCHADHAVPSEPFWAIDRKVREVLDHLDLESSRVLESSSGFGSLGPGRVASEGLTGWKQVRRSSVGLPGPSLTLRCGRWAGDTPSICICKLYLYCIFISYLYLYLYFYYMGGSRAPSFSVAGGRQDRHGRLVLQLRKYRNHPQLLPLYRHNMCNISKYKYK